MQLLDRSAAVEWESRKLSTGLARWYSRQSTIRRLRAIDDSSALTILVTLEPTSDGDDSFPTWLAMQDQWMSDLRTLANRELQLKLVAAEFDVACCGGDAQLIADICWRDACAIP